MPIQDNIAPETIDAFLHVSRRYFDPGIRNILRLAARAKRRPLWRSLVLLGSIGTALGQPVLAADSVRLPDDRKSHDTSASTKTRQTGETQPLTGRRKS